MNIINLTAIIYIIYSCTPDNIPRDETISNIETNGNIQKVDTSYSQKGFLELSFSEIYFEGKEFAITDENNETIFSFKKKRIEFNNKSYDLVEDEHLYKDDFQINTFFPDYGLFVLEVTGQSPSNFQVRVNGKHLFVSKEKYHDIAMFKTPEEYVLSHFPFPTSENPVRVAPDLKALVLEGYENYTFLPIEIQGDWLKIKDDKNCYPGEEPSKVDVSGWIRWKKGDKIILEIRHVC